MQVRKFEVEPFVIDFYVAQIKQLCEDLREDYLLYYQQVHKVIWRTAENVWSYKRGADIDIISDLLCTISELENAYLEAIESDEFYSDIIIVDEDI